MYHKKHQTKEKHHSSILNTNTHTHNDKFQLNICHVFFTSFIIVTESGKSLFSTQTILCLKRKRKRNEITFVEKPVFGSKEL